MIPSVPYGFFYHRGNVVPVQAFVFHLRSFKRGVRDNPYSAYFTFDTLSHYCDDKIRKFLRYHLLKLVILLRVYLPLKRVA